MIIVKYDENLEYQSAIFSNNPHGLHNLDDPSSYRDEYLNSAFTTSNGDIIISGLAEFSGNGNYMGFLGRINDEFDFEPSN